MTSYLEMESAPKGCCSNFINVSEVEQKIGCGLNAEERAFGGSLQYGEREQIT